MPGSTSAIPPTVPAALAAPHAFAADAVAAALGVDPTIGLADDEAVERLARHGPNVLSEERRSSPWSALIEAVTEPFVLLLLAAGGLAVLVGEVRDGTLVLLGLLPIVGADIVTSYRAERALQTLRDAAAPMARVRRGAAVREEASVSLVPGDIVLLRIGEIVPADIRLLRADALLADASALTGESVPELASSLPDVPHAVLAERRSMVYGGTGIVGGHGEGIVVATGAATEVGRIAGSLTTAERRRSPLQRELDRLVRILVVVATVLITITTASVFLRQGTIGEAVIAGVSAAIAAIPEEPPVLLAVILGLGAFRLLRRGVLVRRLSAQETLGAIDLIITDKTGTLTMNRISVGAVLTPDGEVTDPSELVRLIGGALRAEADAWQIRAGGSPGSFTRALLAAADGDRELDPGDLVSAAEPTQRKPYSETWSREEGRILGWAIGAPEAILALPSTAGGDTAAWHDAVEDEAERGGRLLLLSSAYSPDVWRPEAIIVFADPLRDGVTEAIATATTAGIQTIVVTGDHPSTALAISRAAGVTDGKVVLGPDLAGWDDATLAREIGHLSIVARAVPEDKLRLVDISRTAGRTVAVTGDGVNDAPALHHADVAVAMGSGTAIARDASDLVLGDDSFATLMDALREGRRMVANVQKGLVFLITTHVALLGFILIATLAGQRAPLLPLQILWLELFIDLSTSIAFEREPEEPGAMRRRPRSRGVPLLTRRILGGATLAGGSSAVAALVLMLADPTGGDHARWLAFTTLVAAQAVRAYANRSLSQPVTRLPRNGFLAAACLATVAVQVAMPSVPALADAFRATHLDAAEWGMVALVALVPAVIAQVIRRASGREWVA